jgi:mannose-6-phosphate isomerase-like protein (cupin superfamily)
VVIIPAGAAQRISNPGSDDLVFLALCVPPFTAEAYEDIEP